MVLPETRVPENPRFLLSREKVQLPARVLRIDNMKQKQMENTQLHLVTFEQAARLKAAGFDWDSMDYYRRGGALARCGRCPDRIDGAGCSQLCQEMQNGLVPAPSVPLALKWVRDVRKLHFGIRSYYAEPGHLVWNYDAILAGPPCGFDTYEAAEAALLDSLTEDLCPSKGTDK